MPTYKDNYKQVYNRFNASPNSENGDVEEFERTVLSACATMLANGYNPRDILSLAFSTMSAYLAGEILMNTCQLYTKEIEND